MKLTVLAYDCDNCGLCCTQTLVWGTPTDTMREPRIRTEARRVKMDGQAEDRWLLNRVDTDGSDFGPCVFHTGEKCGVYGSRPNVCAGFPAGGVQCQQLRESNGLPRLEPRPEEIEEAYIHVQRADLPDAPSPVTLGQSHEAATAPGAEPSASGDS